MSLSGKIGCLFIYSIILIIVGMGLYKYREEVMEYVSEKYDELVHKADHKIDNFKKENLDDKSY